MSALINANNIIWIDLEMTGLNVEEDRILEMACIITDGDLNIVAKGPNLVVHESDAVLANMNDWCKEHHAKTQLIDAVRKSTYSVQQVEKEMLNFIKQYCPERSCPIAGNSIYMDRLFLKKYMPGLDEYAHYRVIDISTIKELCKRWNKLAYESAPPKQFVHRSLNDIEESIGELKYYRETFMKTK
ncbi:oligoribonuclease, mitochondrial [Anopheles ziemanni]|nr:oligoribonuclease, mitochondrial isoform X2 [Anopheles coustani]XP_058166832.1 oligoribonuclease, mitochondrial [Anopheles ziemanni]